MPGSAALGSGRAQTRARTASPRLVRTPSRGLRGLGGKPENTNSRAFDPQPRPALVPGGAGRVLRMGGVEGVQVPPPAGSGGPVSPVGGGLALLWSRRALPSHGLTLHLFAPQISVSCLRNTFPEPCRERRRLVRAEAQTGVRGRVCQLPHDSPAVTPTWKMSRLAKNANPKRVCCCHDLCCDSPHPSRVSRRHALCQTLPVRQAPRPGRGLGHQHHVRAPSTTSRSLRY